MAPGAGVLLLRTLHEPGADATEASALAGRCIARCSAESLPELGEEIRRSAAMILLDPVLLRGWLHSLPAAHRVAEEARALREVVVDERRARVLLFLLAWPDLAAAARLVVAHHRKMVGQSCETFNAAAKHLEPTAPLAAMLLYRRGAFCRFSTSNDMTDDIPRMARAAALWEAHADSLHDSHATFVDKLTRHRYRGV